MIGAHQKARDFCLGINMKLMGIQLKYCVGTDDCLSREE